MRFRQSQFLSGFCYYSSAPAPAWRRTRPGRSPARTDPNNDVVANATITVTNKATGAVGATRSGGVYSVENLLPGEYEVKVEAQGIYHTASGSACRRWQYHDG